MRGVQHPSNTRVLGAPVGWAQFGDGEVPCGALPVTDVAVGNHDCVVSYWKPTPYELELLAAGAFVSLYVIGRTMPPVSVCVER